MWIAESPSTRDTRLIWYRLKTRGVKRLLTGSHYDEDFYAEHIKLKPAYQELADLIFARFHPESVYDFGCGNGFLLQFLAERGVAVAGFEGSEASLNFIDSSLREKVLIRDLSQAIDTKIRDLVISTEVAEHLPKKAAPVLVRNLTSSASRTIVFSAAKPGQWGDGHINCQPKEFWIKLFALCGWNYDRTTTNDFTSDMKRSSEISTKLPWLVDNFMLFVPGKLI
jgi:SAM-dependent methyltransferase